MEQKFKIGLLLWSLVMTFAAIGLEGCDKDDDLTKGVYEGYIVEANPGAFTIKVTYSPYDIRYNMPLENELMYGSTPDSPDLELEVNQELSFRIISVEELPIFHIYAPETCPIWDCDIKIIKLD